MLFQNLLICALFLGAVAYVARLGWRIFQEPSQAGCAKGCGGCSEAVLDRLAKAEAELTGRT